MASLVGRVAKETLLRTNKACLIHQACKSTFRSRAKKLTLGLLGVGGAGVALAIGGSVLASDLELHPGKYPWEHNGLITPFDMASVRRGYQVYKQVCAACHTMDYMHYRQLVDVFMTEEEAKAEAAEVMVTDGPDDEGNMFERPGKLFDPFPKPYPNDEAARAANNGALPPDLNFITFAREGGQDYIFSLLTGYCDPPAGIEVKEGQHYNPYFPGGLLGMQQALYNEIIEYEDGTPATQSQLAKDVTTFFHWAGQPQHDRRKKLAVQFVPLLLLMLAASYYWKKHTWALLKSRKMLYNPPKN